MSHCTPPSTVLALPTDLAPALVERVLQLLEEVATTRAPDVTPEPPRRPPRCVVCHRSGKLGGHHGVQGQIEWIHRGCHRRLHRRGRGQVRDMRRVPSTTTARRTSGDGPRPRSEVALAGVASVSPVRRSPVPPPPRR